MPRRKKTSSKRKTSRRKKTTQRSLPWYLTIPLILILAVLYLLQAEGILDLGLPGPLGPFEPEVTPTLEVVTTTPVSFTTPVPGGQWYTAVYFTTPKYPDKPEDHHGGIDEKLVAAVQKAQRTIDIAAYEFDLENVAEALIAAEERGVEVRFVTDSDNMDEEEIKALKKMKIKVIEDDRGAIMHNKFIIIDGHEVWTGSWNLTENGTYRNNNNVIVIDSPELAKNYQAEFNEMFEGKEFGPTSSANTPHPTLTINGVLVENYFAPEDEVNKYIIAHLEEAQKSIYFMAFSFTDDRIGEVLVDKALAGLTVDGIFEKRGSDTEHSEYGQLRKKGAGVLVDGNKYILHHKVFIIDERTVVLGSYNFSKNAAESNDENVLIVHDPGLAALYLEEYQRMRTLAESAQ
jgi:phosphatidylserine/phosphatidylglycerophosphate/cardiolipin synthase-like enzyme